VLTHPSTDLAAERRLELLATNISIDASSRIDVSARGYLGGGAGGNGSQIGATLGNVLTGGSVRAAEEVMGAWARAENAEPNVNQSYGSFRDPNELGSGGGSDSGPAGNGGGVGGGLLRPASRSRGRFLQTVEGAQPSLEGGSGGGIKITTSTMSGSGQIQARGGLGASQSGSGAADGSRFIIRPANSLSQMSRLSAGEAIPGKERRARFISRVPPRRWANFSSTRAARTAVRAAPLN
jgi:hypothetical protein